MVGGLSWGYVGPHLGAMLAHLGAMLAHLGGVMLAHLEAMLADLKAYVGPCWPISSHKLRKMGKNGNSKKHCKTREFLAGGSGRRQGLLRRGENCRTYHVGPAGPWPDIRWPPLPPTHPRTSPTVNLRCLVRARVRSQKHWFFYGVLRAWTSTTFASAKWKKNVVFTWFWFRGRVREGKKGILEVFQQRWYHISPT